MNKRFTPSIILPSQNYLGNTYFPKPKLIKTNVIDGFGNSKNTNNNITIRDSYGNNIGNGADNIQLFASNNNQINGGLTNVVMINTDNTTVTESNVTYINGVKFNPNGSITGLTINWGGIGGTLSDQTDLQAALNSKFNNPSGTASQYIKGDGTIGNFPIDIRVTGGTYNSSTGNATFTNNTGGTFTVTGFTSGVITGITSTDNTIFADLNNNNYNLSVRAVVAEIRNETGVALTKGQAVYLSGASGNKALAWLAKADTETTSSGTIGLILSDIPNNQNGYAVINGKIQSLDTTAFSAGTKLWLSETIAGGLTSTIPSAPNHPVHIGVVSRSHVNQGSIELNIYNTPELRELSDVSASTITNGQTLVWDSTLNVFKPYTIPSSSSSDVFVTGGTYNSGTTTATFTNNTGGTFTVTGFTTNAALTGLTDTQFGLPSTFGGAPFVRWDTTLQRWTNGGVSIRDVGGDTQGVSANKDMFNSNIPFRWLSYTGTTNMFSLFEFAASTGNAYLFNVATVAGSNAKPISVIARGTNIIDSTAIGGLSLTSLPTGGPLTIGGGMTTGTTTIGGAAQTGTITLGSSSATNIVNLGTGAGATTVNIANGVTNAKTLNIGTGAAMANAINIGGTGANVIAIGNTQTAGSVNIGNAMTTGTIILGGPSMTSGSVSIGNRTTGTATNPTISIGGTANLTAGATPIAQTITLGAGTSAAGAGSSTVTINVANTQIDASSGAAGLSQTNVNIASGTLVNIGASTAPQKNLNLGNGNVSGFNSAGVTATINMGSGTMFTGDGGRSVQTISIGNGLIDNQPNTAINSAATHTVNISSGNITNTGLRGGTVSRTVNIGGGSLSATTSALTQTSTVNIGVTGITTTGGGIATNIINLFSPTTASTINIGSFSGASIGMYGVTAVPQSTTASASATRVGGGGTTLTDTDTYDGYTMAQVVRALRQIGILQ